MPRPIASRLLATAAVLSALAVSGVLITPALAAAGSAQRIEHGSLSMHNSVAGSRQERSPAAPLWCMPCG